VKYNNNIDAPIDAGSLKAYIDNNINENMSGSINRTKPLHREDKIKSFFDD